MAHVVNDYLSSNALVMGREDFVRPMSFGNNWNKLRVAVRYAFFPTNADVIYPRFAIGVSNGTDKPYGVPDTTDFMGLVYGGSAGGNGLYQSWTYNSTSYSWNNCSQIADQTRKVGSVYTQGLGYASTTADHQLQPQLRRRLVGEHHTHDSHDLFSGPAKLHLHEQNCP